MDITPIIENLNDAQREAVTTQEQCCLVLAGAGSGKTRVLVHRIAYVLATQQCQTNEILSVTFTNKAAAEMRARVSSLVDQPLHGMWLGTFHSLSHRILRLHFQEAELDQNFQILDQDDQLRLIKKITKANALDEQEWPPRKTQSFINQCKEQGKRANQIEQQTINSIPEQLIRIYQQYEETCQRQSMVDFTELLLKCVEVLQVPEVRSRYQSRFKCILIDEFQDTNKLQYKWLQLLAGPDCMVMAVGDDDQSIYSWRGAQLSHMLQFSQDFTPSTTIRLEQNYRSTQNILNAANAIIANNNDRLGKQLWTDDSPGELLSLFEAYHDLDEAKFVIEEIQTLQRQNHRLQDIAILYRSNAQSRLFEEQCHQAQVPYQVYGGFRFFDRAEIKDCIAYLKAIINHHNDTAIERIINNPPRGIGHQTLSQLRQIAAAEKCSLWSAISHSIIHKQLNSRALSALSQFQDMIKNFHQNCSHLEAYEIAKHVIEHAGFIPHLQKTEHDKAQQKIENMMELVTAIRYQDHDNNLSNMDQLSHFVESISFQEGPSQQNYADDAIQLMTLHAAKGLEFKTVFLVGLEEELFPHRASMHDNKQLEEERRLCYVGITRAREKLYLSHAETRRLYGQESYQRPSRFINELPFELIEMVRQRHSTHTYSPSHSQAGSTPGFHLSENVKHPEFGLGVVLNVEGNSPHQRVQVRFESAGVKWLLTEFALLEKL